MLGAARFGASSLTRLSCTVVGRIDLIRSPSSDPPDRGFRHEEDAAAGEGDPRQGEPEDHEARPTPRWRRAIRRTGRTIRLISGSRRLGLCASLTRKSTPSVAEMSPKAIIAMRSNHTIGRADCDPPPATGTPDLWNWVYSSPLRESGADREVRRGEAASDGTGGAVVPVTSELAGLHHLRDQRDRGRDPDPRQPLARHEARCCGEVVGPDSAEPVQAIRTPLVANWPHGVVRFGEILRPHRDSTTCANRALFAHLTMEKCGLQVVLLPGLDSNQQPSG